MNTTPLMLEIYYTCLPLYVQVSSDAVSLPRGTGISMTYTWDIPKYIPILLPCISLGCAYLPTRDIPFITLRDNNCFCVEKRLAFNRVRTLDLRLMSPLR